MFSFVLCLSLAIAAGKAFPADFNFYPTGLQSNDLYDLDGYDFRPYRVPANPYYVYDVSEGRWIPRCNVSPSFQRPAYDSVPPSVPQSVPVVTNHRQRANRRQSVLHPGHSATFDAFRGAIAFG